MQNSSRLYHCCRCHAQVIICSHCDRGQRYCTGGCSADARASSLKRASKKYLSTRAGRFNNAARQARFRERKKQKVTHHGSSPVVPHCRAPLFHHNFYQIIHHKICHFYDGFTT